MKITKAIFGVDDSYFLEFWPIQAKICKELLGVEPILFYICNEDSDFYHDGNGMVKKIKKVISRYNIIEEYSIKKIYPSTININIKPTKLVARLSGNDQLVGANGKSSLTRNLGRYPESDKTTSSGPYTGPKTSRVES